MLQNSITKRAMQLIAGAIIAGSVMTHAQAADALSVKLQAHQLVMQNGKPVLKAVTRANSGDVIQYTATYRNNIKKPMTNLAVTLPVPTSMVYIGEASPMPTLASLDGKTFEAIPIKRIIDGKEVQIPASQYRAVRWVIPNLAAQQEATVSMNAKVR